MALQAERLKNQEMSGGPGEPRLGGLLGRLKERPRQWGEFLHEVRVEMRQVTWPSRNEVVTTTFVVITAVVFFSIYFFGVDSGVSYLLNRLFTIFKH